MGIDTNFWLNRSVFLTGHTGFKGGWLTLWLSFMGAKVSGYSLEPPTNPSFFKENNLTDFLENSTFNDIQNFVSLKNAIKISKPSVIIHMAAQPLVKKSYIEPKETYLTNIIGTVNLLEAARAADTVEAIINVTTDKCYENIEQIKAYNENDKLGGYDPYSSSKACAELVSASYRNSFLKDNNIKLATVRAGNVIGGGDWASDRLIPDVFRTINKNKKLYVRSPNAIRPWQHVLEPLSGYLILAEKLVTFGDNYAEAWNFGPEENESKTVKWVIEYLSQKIPNIDWEIDKSINTHEASFLLLDSSKAKSKLNWKPKWPLKTALDKTIEWYIAWEKNKKMSDVSISQIKSFNNLL